MKKIILMFIIVIFLVGTISALEFDNIKTYDEVTKTATITNAFGLGETISENRLITPEIYEVPTGYEKVAEFEINNYYDGYKDVISKMEFYDVRAGMKSIEKEFDYKLLTYEEVTVNDYEYQCIANLIKGGNDTCSNNIVGSHKEQREKWIDFDYSNLGKGKYTVGIFTNVREGDYVEWVPTMFGRRIDEWATYVAGESHTRSTTLVMEYNLTDQATAFRGGIKITMGAEDMFLTKVTVLPSVTASHIYVMDDSYSTDLDSASITSGNATFNYILNASTTYYIMAGNPSTTWTVSRDDALSFPINMTEANFVAGRQSAEDDANRAWAIQSLDLAPKEIYVPTPNVTLHYPTNNTNFTTTNLIVMNATLFDDFNITNSTLYLNNVGNETNSTAGINNSVYTFTKNIGEGDTYWLIQACNFNNKCVNSSTRLFTINTTPQLSLTAPDDYSNLTYNNVKFNSTVTEKYDIKNVSFYLNGVLNETDTSGTSGAYVFSKYLVDGYYTWYEVTCSSNGGCNTSETRNLSIDSTLPSITITGPPSVIEFLSLNHNVSFNWTVSDSNLDTCIVEYDGTNNTVTCGDNTFDFNITSYSLPKTATFYANDTVGNENSVIRTWDYRLFLDSETYDTSVTEGEPTTFSANFYTNGSDITLANLSYNTEQQLGTITENSANNFTVSKTIFAASVSSNSNISFFWNITQGLFNYALASKNQTIIAISLDDCTTNKIVLYNFTMVNETTQTQIRPDNTSGALDLSIYRLGTSIELANITKDYSGTNSMTVCINASLTDNYNLGGVVEYDGEDYVKEFYNFQNETINSATRNNITLYDLLDGLSQEFKLELKDSSYLPLTETLVKVKRLYVDEGTKKIVELPITDGNGETIAHLVTNDVLYTFELIKNGVTLATFSDVRASCQTPLVTTCALNFNTISSNVEVPNYEDDADFTYTLDYNETSRIITSTFSIPGGTSAKMDLIVIKEDALGTSVCTDTITSDTGTLTCVIPNSIGNSTVLAKLERDDIEIAKGSIKLDQTPTDIYGEVLVFLGLFVMFTLIGASISSNPVFTIIFFMVGVILLTALNLVANNGFIGGTATILWLIMAIVIVLIKGARRN